MSGQAGPAGKPMTPLGKLKSDKKGDRVKQTVPTASGRRSRVMNGTKSADTVLTEERDALVYVKQSELDQVIDEHDDMVREAFHLEKFVTLLHYDPKESKKDQSAVFKEYKAKYDLLSQAPTAGPSRQTRRRATELLESLKGSVSPKRPTGKKDWVSGQAPDESPLSSSTFHPKTRIAALETFNSDKGKHKARDSFHKNTGDISFGEASSSAKYNRRSRQDRLASIDNSRSGFASIRRQSHIDDDALPFLHDPPPSPLVLGRSKRPLRSLRSSVASSPAPDNVINGLNGTTYLTGNKRSRRLNYEPLPEGRVRKKRQSHSTLGHISDTHDFSPGDERPSVGDKTIPKPALGKRKSEETLSTWQSRIKRVKLMVRKPPPSISHPAQRPLPVKFGNSISAFLESYITIDDIDYNEDGARQKAIKDAQLLNKINSFKRKGRLMLQPDVALALLNTPGEHHHVTPTESTVVKRPTDAWSSIIDTIILRRRDNRGPRGFIIASQIASRIRTYWEGMAIKEEKARATEEKRLRALAKSTMKMVTSEWKRAVFYLRDQERQRIDAEQKRIGRQHLDALLSQSGQILEAQQYDFSKFDEPRSRSRSSGHSSMSSSSENSEAGSDVDVDEVSESEDDEATPVTFEIDPIDYEDPTEIIDDVTLGVSEFESSAKAAELQSQDPLIENYRIAGSQSTTDSHTVLEQFNETQQNDHSEVYIEDVEVPPSPEMERSSDTFGNSEAYLEVPANVFSEQSEYSTMCNEHHRVLSEENLKSKENVLSHNKYIKSISLDALYGSSVKYPQSESNEQTPSADTDTREHSPIPEDDNGIHEDLEEWPSQTTQLARLSSSSPSHPTEIISTSINGISKEHCIFDHSFETHSRDEANTNIIGDAHAESSDVQSTIAYSRPQSPIMRTLESPSITNDQKHIDLETASNAQQYNSIKDSGVPQITEDADEEDVSYDTIQKMPAYLEPYAVAQVDYDPQDKIKPPILLRGNLRPYQQSGLEWLASLHTSHLNGILADEMGLGKTIQTISLLAHLACDRGIWGPHLIIVPTSVLLNWEMEFKKFLPGFKILSYHGTTKRRKEIRQGWNSRHSFNVCVTSYSLASRDAHIFKRKAWYYMILDEAHMIKNFKSQRWNILLAFRSYRRLLLTGTPLQNNLTELWALLQFLMSGTDFANLREFGEWFSNPLEKAIEQGTVMDEETQKRVTKLHTVLRPYLLRRLKRDVEKELPSKYEHLVLCRLSKRQRFLYDEFMSRAQTQDDLKSGVYQKVANILMQLRKVCNHPDLFEVRPIVTSFAMERSAIADFEIKDLLIRRRLLSDYDDSEHVNLDLLGLNFTSDIGRSLLAARETKALNSYTYPSLSVEDLCNPPMVDSLTISGFKKYRSYQKRVEYRSHCEHVAYINNIRCNRPYPIYGAELLKTVGRFYEPLFTANVSQRDSGFKLARSMVKTCTQRADDFSDIIDKFAFATPNVVARDLPRLALAEVPGELWSSVSRPEFDAVLHRAAVKLQIAFPDLSLLQYDCGKLQELDRLLRMRKSGGHRVLIFTQMTKVLDILEIFLNFHGYLYLRLDGATKIEDRQYITERFNADERVFAFIASSRSGGVGINLTGADTVIFYDSDFNPQMDRQCEDRAHRIGQIRDVHIYRFVSAYTVEEAMLRKANQKRSLDDIVIQRGEFDWRNIFGTDQDQSLTALETAMGDFEDVEDAHAAQVAANEQAALEGEDQNDFAEAESVPEPGEVDDGSQTPQVVEPVDVEPGDPDQEEEEQAVGSISEYMLSIVRADLEFFREWKI